MSPSQTPPSVISFYSTKLTLILNHRLLFYIVADAECLARLGFRARVWVSVRDAVYIVTYCFWTLSVASFTTTSTVRYT